MPKVGHRVKVYMGFVTEGVVEQILGNKYHIYIEDPMCGNGIFAFTKWDETNKRFTV